MGCVKGNLLSDDEFEELYYDIAFEFRSDEKHRRMIHLEFLEPSQNINPEAQFSDDAYETFSVLSYNIHSHLRIMDDDSNTTYKNCPELALQWGYRRQNLLHEIVKYNADIICFQEVQRDHLEKFFEPKLTAHGYSVSVMCKKDTSNEVGIDDYSNGECVTFYRANRFKKIEESSEFDFGESKSSVTEAPESEQNPDSGVIPPEKANLALILKLEVIRDGGTSTHEAYQPAICVVNTRIYSQADDSNKTLNQVLPFVLKLENSVQPEIPLLICGDLNFCPESNAHEFLLRHDEVIDSESRPKLDSVLKSAYASLFAAAGIEEQQLNKMDRQKFEPLFTKFTSEFCGTVDYILYRASTMKVVGLLELLERQSLGDGLPSIQWSSDHIALMAKFRLIPPSTSPPKSPPESQPSSSSKESPAKQPPKLSFRDALLMGRGRGRVGGRGRGRGRGRGVPAQRG